MSVNNQYISFSKEDFVDFLKEFTSFKSDIGLQKANFRKPTHGPCCTCQKCGYDHDDCVCCHNELIDYIEELNEKSRSIPD